MIPRVKLPLEVMFEQAPSEPSSYVDDALDPALPCLVEQIAWWSEQIGPFVVVHRITVADAVADCCRGRDDVDPGRAVVAGHAGCRDRSAEALRLPAPARTGDPALRRANHDFHR
jgi:hypothetical protein